MSTEILPLPADENEEISALIETLHETEQRLDQLTAGEVDTVADREGRTILLRRTQEYMRHSEAARQAAILNALPAHIALLNGQGRIISVNQAWRQFTGSGVVHAPGHEIGLDYLGICDGARGENGFTARQAAAGTRSVLDGAAESFSIEYACHSPNQQRWFLMTVTPLVDGQRKGVVVMHLDITGQKRAQEEQRATSHLLDNIVENIPTAVQLKSVRDDYRIQMWNKAAEAMFGLPREAAIGRNVHDLWSEPDANPMRDADLAVVAQGGIQDFPDRPIRTQNRGIIHVHLRKVGLVGPDGEVSHLLVIADDITERKRAEQILKLEHAVAISLADGTEAGTALGSIVRAICETEGWDVGRYFALDEAAGLLRFGESWSKGGQAIGEFIESSRTLTFRPGEGLVGSVWQSGEPLWVADADADPRVMRAAKLRAAELHAMCVFPVRADGKTIGVLSFSGREIQAPDARLLQALLVIGGQIGQFVVRQAQQKRIARLNRIYKVLSGINTLIVRVHDREELFREACRIAVEEGRFMLAWIGIADRRSMVLKVAASSDSTHGFMGLIPLGLTESAPGGVSLAARAVFEGKPLIANNIETGSLPLKQEALALGFRSLVALPLMDAAGVAGVLSLYAETADFFDQEEMKLLLELAGDISFAIDHINRQAERKQAEARIVQLNRVYAVLSGINALIVRARDRDELFKGACRIAVEAGAFRMAWLGIVDARAMKIVPVASAGAEPEFLTLIQDRFSLREDAPMGNTMSARAVREKKAMVSNEIKDDTKVLFARERVERGISSMAILPLLVAGNAVGVLALYADQAGFFDAEELKLLTELAGDIAFAIDHLDNEAERKQAEARIVQLNRVYAMLSGINTLIVHARDRDELFRESSRIAVEHGKFRMAWIGIVDRASGLIKPIASAGDVRNFLEVAPLDITEVNPDSLGLAGRAVAHMKPMISNDVQNDPQRLMKKEMGDRGINSHALLPLIVGGEAIGVLALYSADVGFFDDEEMKLLLELAGDISFAVDHLAKAEKINYLAYFDALTGLANRSLFLERVAQSILGGAAKTHSLAVVAIDIERFKLVNETLGRSAGDELLQQIAARFVHTPAEQARYARLGADQFAVMIPEVESEEWLMRRLENSLERYFGPRFKVGDTELKIAARLGIAIFPNDGADAEILLTNAESALKKAKAGGEKYLFYTQQMTDRVAGRLTLENQLRQALEREEFVLHYQPKVNLGSGKLTSAEALIRWNDPRTGLVPPGRFIPILEETGLIYEVGRWALRQAIEDYRRWRFAGLPAVRIAVNVSPLQLRNRNFIEEVKQAIGGDALVAAGLEVEITESLIMEDVTRNIAILKTIREMGVSIALDDFGTGYSSLSLLGKLPVDTLKIDRSFVIEMTVGPNGLALVQTIISLAHGLGLKVVAEGVETEEQSHLLRLLGCDEMQGWLFSKALPGEIFEAKFLVQDRVA